MDKSLREHGIDTQREVSLIASLQIIGRILKWLVGFFQLTEEEQKKAGILPRDHRYE